MSKPKLTVNKRGDKFWKLNGVYHNENGPALELANGSKEWWINGQPHREDGPAVIDAIFETKYWYINGKKHRIDGPAVIYPDGTERWYINGNYICNNKFLIEFYHD